MLALELQTLVGHVARFLFRLHDVELVAGLGSAVETEHRGGVGGTHLFDTLAALVEEGFYAAVVCAGHNDVALTERSVGDEHRGDVAAAFVERTFDDRTDGAAVGVGFEFEHVGFEQHLLKEFVDTDAFLGRDVLALVLTAPFFHKVVHRGERGLDGIGVGAVFVNLVDGKDDGHTSCCGVVDGLLGLGHHVVVGRNDDDGNVGDLGTTSTHGGESFVTGSVEEGDLAAVLEFHVVGSDVLSDAAGLACNDVGVADVVEQRSLTVVDVPHDGHDRSALHEVFGVVLLFDDGFLHFGRNKLGGEAKLFGHHFDGLLVEALVDGHHDADAHARSDDLRDGNVHHRGQFVGRHKLGEFQYAAFGIALHEFLFLTLAGGIALLLAVLRALALAGALGLKAGEGLLHLLGYVFVRRRCDHSGSLSLLALGLLSLLLRVLRVVLAALSTLASVALLGFGVHIHTLGAADAGALLLVVALVALAVAFLS